MADLINLVQSQLGGQTMNMIAQQIGGNKQQTSTAVSAALPMIIQALNRNASNEQGAESLFNAVAKDHDGSVLNDIAGVVGNFQSGPGAGILKHLLGSKQNNAASMLANMSGLNSQSAENLLQILAPIVMGQLGKQKQNAGLDIGGLVNLLANNTDQQQKRNPQAASFLNKFLDQDNDGNIQDDLANFGLKALGSLFSRKK